MTKKVLLGFFSLALTVSIAGCGDDAENDAANDDSRASQLTPEEAEKEIEALNAAGPQ